MKKKIEDLIISIYDIPYSKSAFNEIEQALIILREYVENNHFLNSKLYVKEIIEIDNLSEDLSVFKSDEDRLLQKRVQKKIANLGRKILEENKKIFIVHGRNINMRDKVSTMLGKLKLEYSILESEQNNGATIIEKFLKNASKCEYAIVLFSADDLGKLDEDEANFKHRPRQNVILELGYFLAHVGRKNIIILHETGKKIESPSDFSGVVYEAFDEYGAWKTKLIKEMKMSGIYIDKRLADST